MPCRNRAALYCRLSKEDVQKHGESESIQNQRTLLNNYAVEKGWDVWSCYVDEDYSGIDRERPAFNRLLEDAMKRRFDIILCKTQSRFTRDMELVEKYLHGLFPLWGIRFIAVVEGADTSIRGNKKARQINGLINEWYLEDLSENIRTVFDMKRREGQFIGSFSAYGYRKDPQNHHKLLIDDIAAETVQEIFRLCLLGMGKQKIAQTLNQRGILNPTAYKHAQGLTYYNGGQTTTGGKWNRTSVGRILHNPVYLGDLVQGTRRKASYKSNLLLPVPKEEWIIVPKTHAPIISTEMYSAVQALLKQRTRSDGTGKAHLFAGKVFCSNCGSSLAKYSHTYQDKRREYLRCGGTQSCSGHTIRLDYLEAILWERLSYHITRYGLDTLKIPHTLRHSRQDHLMKEILLLQTEIEKRQKAMQMLYLDKAAGLFSDEQFLTFRQAYEQEIATALERQTLLQQQTTQAPTTKETFSITEFTRGLVLTVIRCIEVGARQSDGTQIVRIFWNF